MKRFYFLLAVSILLNFSLTAQVGETPNYANSAQLPSSAAQSDKMMSNPVNLYTGLPNISVPIFNYKSNSGLSLGVSINYAGGGIQLGESPSFVGLGWFLNTGGMITRTVRGKPDDFATYGYMYSDTIQADWRSNSTKYYYDSLDTQQDIFQFNFPGHSGKFVFSKTGEIIIIPASKIKIIPTFTSYPITNARTLMSFRVITEDGVKYDFEEEDITYFSVSSPGIVPPSDNYNVAHGVGWTLTRMISAFNTDTIRFNYQTQPSGEYSFSPPQITFVNNSTQTRKNPYNGTGSGISNARVPSSIEFPDQTRIDFLYSKDIKYNEHDYALSKIKISDTTFRFGYLFEYLDSAVVTWTWGIPASLKPIRVQLKSITPYTAKEKQSGYLFTYDSPLPLLSTTGSFMLNQRDHWGYYNGIDNGDSSIPQINSYTWGADRHSTYNSLYGTLKSLQLPTGGSIGYGYELNEHYPYTKEQNSFSVNLQYTTQTTLILNQVLSNTHQLAFFLDKSIARTGSSPISGSGLLNLAIKSTNGVTTYATGSISLNELFYSGLRRWTFNVPNGTYMLETNLSGGTGTGGSFPVSVEWENKNLDSTVTKKYSGGLRIKNIFRTNETPDVIGSYEEYSYVLEDGRSSGYLGEIPRYDYPFRENYPHLSTTVDYTAVLSEPLGTAGYAQIGYSRVEVMQKSYSGNLGKAVNEFTDLKDVNTNTFNQSFPYTPFEIRSWALGLPKRVIVYDSAGNIVKKTVNSYTLDTIEYKNKNFKSIKMGHGETTFYAGTVNAPSQTNKTRIFIADDYYPSGGRIYLSATTNTLYHTNGSYQTSYQQLVYDTNYNVTKIITSYDRNRGLEKEQRFYYTYNYTTGGGIGILRDSAIISQLVGTETWITGDANPRMLDGAVTSFKQIANGDIKPDTIYVFESNKPVLQSTIGTFNTSVLNRNTTYFKPQSNFVSYNSKGNLTEAKNLVTGQSSSSLIDYKQQYTIAAVSNASQTDIAYTSFESEGTGNWTVGSSSRDLSQNMSGKKSYNLTNGTVSKSGLSSGKEYLVTYWLYSGASATINGSSAGTAIATQNGWYLYSKKLTGITSVTISGSGLIDEVRLHPTQSNMQTSAYEPLIGVITTMDANNGVIYTEYDNLNRVKLLRDKDRNIVKRFDYSDTTMAISRTPLWVGIGRQCATLPGHVDTIYKDMNIYSDSAGYIRTEDVGYLDCSCPNVSSDPQYKVVNGTCEMGTWAVTSSVYKKVLVGGLYQWRWVCTYHYCFSDGSQSTYYYEEINTSSCQFSCLIEL